MSRESKTRDVNGLLVTCTQLPAMQALRLATMLAKVLGPALSAAKGLSAQSELSEIGGALSSAFESLSPSEASTLTLAVLKSVTVEEKGVHIRLTSEDTIDTVFSGRLSDLLTCVMFALEVNFTEFFTIAPKPKGMGERVSQ